MKVAKTNTASKTTIARPAPRKPVPPSPDLTKKLEAAFKKADCNGDGKLSVDEYICKRAGDALAFAKADTSGDKLLDMAEWLRANLPGKQPPGKRQ